jgi:hypothetical protein
MPHGGARHARSAGHAAGLGRRTPHGPERLPSVRPESGEIRADEVAFAVHVRGLHLAPSRSPRAPPASSKAGGSLRAIPPAPGSSRVAPRLTVPARKMRLSDVCNRLSTRAPCVPSDSRLRPPPATRPLDPAALGFAWIHRRPPNEACAPPATTDASSGGASLDGDPPASASPHSPGDRVGTEAPSVHLSSTAWSWWSLIELLQTVLLVAALSAACRACSSASDALCRNDPVRAPHRCVARVDHRQVPPPPPPRQRRPLRRNQDAFPRRVPSPPLLHPTSARAFAG